ncbi:MAG: GNAT family N-acetyltransferase [Paracoccaceae bacterium]
MSEASTSPRSALLTQAFAYMDSRIDPPPRSAPCPPTRSRAEAAAKEVWVIEQAGAPIACMILTPKPDTLYLGKLATDPGQRRKGLAAASSPRPRPAPAPRACRRSPWKPGSS